MSEGIISYPTITRAEAQDETTVVTTIYASMAAILLYGAHEGFKLDWEELTIDVKFPATPEPEFADRVGFEIAVPIVNVIPKNKKTLATVVEAVKEAQNK